MAIINLPIACNRGVDSPGGVNLRDDSVGFAGRFSPYVKNMVVEPTRIRKRLGYTKVGANLPLAGAGTGLFEYIDNIGTKHFIATTTLACYEYDASSNLWLEISPDSALTGDVDDVFRGGVVTDVGLFTGNGGSALVLTNNIDDLIAYEGHSGSKFETLIHSYTSFASCIDLQEFWNHLVLLGVTDSTYHARQLDWADFADADDWSGGTSGSTVLTDSVGALMRAVKLGPYMVLYSERSISLCQYGNVDVVFVVPTLVYGTGLLCRDAVWGDANSHRFVGSDLKLWRYDGGSLLTRIGDVVDTELFRRLNYSVKQRVRCGYDPARQKFIVAFPRASESYAKALFVQSVGLPGEPWEYHEFADDVVAIASLEAIVEAYCDAFTYGVTVLLGVDGLQVLGADGNPIVIAGSSTGETNPWANLYCDEVAAYCDDPLGQTGVPTCCFATSDGYVYKLDESTGYDDDAEIECEYQTEDVTVDMEHSFGRWQWFSFTARSVLGGTVDVSYSTDCGETWVALVDSPVTLSASWTTHRLPLSVASERVRFKLWQHSSKDLQLRGVFRVQVEPGVARG
jgi:hypothetical protein